MREDFQTPAVPGNGIPAILCKIWQRLADGITATVSGGDIEIGAVEIKDATSDVRTVVTPAGALSVDGSAVTQPVSIAGNQDVNLAQVAGVATPTGNGTAAGALRVVLPTDGIGVVGLNAGAQIIGRVGIDQTTPGTTNAVAIITGQNGVAGNSGLVSATTVRVSQATDVPVSSIGFIANPTGNFTRPGDTTPYASGDLVANSTTAGSVVPVTLAVARVNNGSVMLRRLKLHKSTTTTTNAAFRVHLFRAVPGTVTNGDNGVFSVSGVADYLGGFDVTIDRAFTDGAAGFGMPIIGNDISVKVANGAMTIFALVEARAAYVPGNAEVITITLDDIQN